MACQVKHCKNLRRMLPPGTNISFHRFPRDEDQFFDWLSAVGLEKTERTTVQWTQNLYVCSDHFHPADLVKSQGRTRLKEGAVPQLFLTPATSKPMTKPLIWKDIIPCMCNTSLKPEFPKGASENINQEETNTEENEISHKTHGNMASESDSRVKTIRKRIDLEHNYMDSPWSTKNSIDKLKYNYKVARIKLYRANRTVKKLKKQVTLLREIIKQSRE